MKQEYVLIIIVGLLILAYVLDAVVNPLSLVLSTPYHFFNPKIITLYPFTATSIFIKTIALFILPLWLLSFFDMSKLTKGAILLVLSGLMQLYALQDVATNGKILPLEWSLALTLTGLFLLIPTVFYIVVGVGKKAHKTFLENPYDKVTGEEPEL